MQNLIKTTACVLAGLALSQDVFAHGKKHRYFEPLEIRVATPFSDGHILADTAYRFEKELERRTFGFIDVTVQTGFMNEQSINPASQSCDPQERVADIVFTGGQPIQDYAPEYFFFNGPYVITDFEHLQRVWRGPVGDDMAEEIEMQGNFITFDPVYRGYRQFTSNAPIYGPDEMDGLLLRLPPVPDWITVWEELNVVPVQVPLTGIYDALATGTAEASEGDLTQIYSLNLYEVQDYLSLTNHLVSFGMPIANACFYRDELSWLERLKVNIAMFKAVRWASEKLQNDEASLLSDLESLGMTVITPDAEAIRTQAEPAINELFDTKWTVTTWQEVLAQ